MSIKSSFHSFHIIIMNFVIDLFDELNVILTMTNKFFRRMLIIIEKNFYFVNQWINLLMNQLLQINWKMFVVIIFDRDSKFLFEMWLIFFKRLNTTILIFIVYHNQIDDFFERINQFIEIIIWFIITNYSNVNFVLTLSFFANNVQ